MNVSLFITIKKTSKYAYQNDVHPSTGKLVPIPVRGIGTGNFGPNTVLIDGNQYPMGDVNFYVVTGGGRYVKLGGR